MNHQKATILMVNRLIQNKKQTKKCGTMMWLLDSEGLCPACNGLGSDEDGEPVYEEEE